MQHFNHKLPYLETLGKLNIDFNFKSKKKKERDCIGLTTQRSWFTQLILQPFSAIVYYNLVIFPPPQGPQSHKKLPRLQFDRSDNQSDYLLFNDSAATNFSACQMIKNEKRIFIL